MNLTIPQLTVIFIAGLLMSGVFSMMEAAIISQDKRRLSHLADSGSATAKLMQAMLKQMDRLLAAILLFNNIANVTCATAATVIVGRLSGGGEGAVFLSSLLVAFLILVLSEISPKIVAVRHATAISLFCARPLRLLLWVFRPVIAIANGLARFFLSLCGMRQMPSLQAAMNVSELASVVRESNIIAHSENKDEQQRHYRMLEQLLRLSEMSVEKIMTPRHQIDGIDLQNDKESILAQLSSSPHAKMPVFENNIDNATGFVDVFAAVKAAMHRGGTITAHDLKTYTSAPQFIPAAANALQQIEKLREHGARAALVVDGTGRVVGMITMFNFATAVLGEELPSLDVHWVSEHLVEVSGDFPIIKLGEIYPPFRMPETTATSLSGLIIETLGGVVPEVDSKQVIGGLKMTILAAGDASVKRVLLCTEVEILEERALGN